VYNLCTYDHIIMSFLIFLILLIKPAFRIGIKNYYTFQYRNYLELEPKLFGARTFIFFHQRTRTEPGPLFYFLRTGTGTDNDKFKRFQSLILMRQYSRL